MEAVGIKRVYLGGAGSKSADCAQMSMGDSHFVERLCCYGIFVGRGSVQETGILRANGNIQTILDGVDKDEITEDVPFDRKQEAVATTLQTLEKIAPTKSHEPRAGGGKED